jgi:hypothetical protein
MNQMPAARFEDTATQQGSQGILRQVGAFVQASGVANGDRDQIARTLAVALAAATEHAAARHDAWLVVTADVAPDDVQLVMRVCPGGSAADDGCDPTGGFELWISFPRY